MKILLIICMCFITLSAESFRIEATNLVKKLNEYTILDTRKASQYKKEHIKNSLNIPAALTYDNKKNNGEVIAPQNAEKLFRNLGLDIDKAIIIYDDGTFYDAARLFWTLEVYGFTNVKILNSGFNEWKKNSYPTSTTTPKISKSNYIPTINNNRLATKFTTQIAIKTPNKIIIDARANPSYIGKLSTAKRFGHIPSATNIPASHNIDNNKLQPINKLKEIYKNVDKNKKIILYCTIGRVSSVNYFALRELGYDVSNYAASWKEWGNDFNLPITNPSKK
ncbi:sulfurtransferase [Sulfurospirillum arcachonense]|uniref:sulfurtransferase n=1 Tax=Sulfurospirillum arcachonense TaxID=57666 RepID=UPI000468B500|nr:rhodanese-like domain-containing protein [Sulfurospirillum arcachonense]